jgi:hypothetical protein
VLKPSPHPVAAPRSSPTAYLAPQGEILTDCVDRSGVPSCLVDGGTWAECDLSKPQGPPLGAEGQLLVADRSTVSGSACLLPAVNRWVWVAMYGWPCMGRHGGRVRAWWEICKAVVSGVGGCRQQLGSGSSIYLDCCKRTMSAALLRLSRTWGINLGSRLGCKRHHKPKLLCSRYLCCGRSPPVLQTALACDLFQHLDYCDRQDRRHRYLSPAHLLLLCAPLQRLHLV